MINQTDNFILSSISREIPNFQNITKDHAIKIFKERLEQANRTDLNIHIEKYLDFDNLDSIIPYLVESEYHNDEVTFVNNKNTLERFGWLEQLNLDQIKSSGLIKDTILKQDHSEKAINNTIVEAQAILGHCNNPAYWELTDTEPYRNNQDGPYWVASATRYYQNKQGLVYGMVQSGKTFNMLALTAIAFSQGFNLVIHLSSDKDSLRTQTQNRINDFFELLHGRNDKHNILSLTNAADYSSATSGQDIIALYRSLSSGGKIIIVIKKNIHILKKLLDDLMNLYEELNQLGLTKDAISSLIIDDEADYATQNTNAGGRTPINDTLIKIRQTLPRNTYVAYTATPQACFGANPNEIIGYPKDFIIPISPVKDDNGVNITYTGLDEFYENIELKLNRIIPEYSWPYHKKNEVGNAQGVFNPITGEINKQKLVDSEREFLKVLKFDVQTDKAQIFQIAILDFLIATSILWFRHHKKYNIPLDRNFSTYKKIIKERKLHTGYTDSHSKEFPYSSMMINMAYYNDMQLELKDFFTGLGLVVWSQITNHDFSNTSIINNINTQYKEQLAKSQFIGKNVPDLIELEYFIKAAYKIAFKDFIYDTHDTIYMLNSTDAGNTLQYEAPDRRYRPKVSSIIIGGLILGRGLTINNLITTIFLRSQASTMGDTSLQMCRWFGHKREIIDILSVYTQQHNFELFREISECDKNLREIVYHEFNTGKKGACALIELRNSPMFRLTSPKKSRFFEYIIGNSFSGRTRYYKGIKQHPEYYENSSTILEFLNSHVSIPTLKSHNRAFVIRDLNFHVIQALFQSLKLSTSENGLKIKEIETYIMECKKEGIEYLFNIGFFGVEQSSKSRFYIKPLNRKLDKDFSASKFVGGKPSDTRSAIYSGDLFIDNLDHPQLEKYFTDNNIKKRQRKKGDNILINFYYLNLNYQGLVDKVEIFLKPGDAHFHTPNDGICFTVNFPLGGLRYSLTSNVLMKEEIVLSECNDENILNDAIEQI